MSGLLAVGKAGKWLIDVDDERDEVHGMPWGLTISHPGVYIQVPLEKLETLGDMVAYLRGHNPERKCLTVSNRFDGELLLDNTDGRLTFRMRLGLSTSTEYSSIFEVNVDPAEALSLVEALEGAIADLR